MAESWQSQAANGSGHVSFQKSKKWAINEGIIQKLPWDTSHGAMRDRNGHKVAQNDGVGLIRASFIGCPRVPVSWCPRVPVSPCPGVPTISKPGARLLSGVGREAAGTRWHVQGPWDPQEALMVPCGCWCISRACTEGASILLYSVIL